MQVATETAQGSVPCVLQGPSVWGGLLYAPSVRLGHTCLHLVRQCALCVIPIVTVRLQAPPGQSSAQMEPSATLERAASPSASALPTHSGFQGRIVRAILGFPESATRPHLEVFNAPPV